MENLIENLKNYKKQGLNLEAAEKKLFKEEGLMLDRITKKLNVSTLPELIEVLEAKSPGKQYEKAIDAFAKEQDQLAKNVQKI